MTKEGVEQAGRWIAGRLDYARYSLHCRVVQRAQFVLAATRARKSYIMAPLAHSQWEQPPVPLFSRAPCAPT
jgi:hypothetical protein